VILRDRLAAIVDDLPPVELAVIFGSTVRAAARPDSDVDIGVRLNSDSAEVRLVTVSS
jgi:predicted nucleotidyltransferase